MRPPSTKSMPLLGESVVDLGEGGEAAMQPPPYFRPKPTSPRHREEEKQSRHNKSSPLWSGFTTRNACYKLKGNQPTFDKFGREPGKLGRVHELTGKLPGKRKEKKKSKQSFLLWFDLFRLTFLFVF